MNVKKKTVSTSLLRLDDRLQCRESIPEGILKEYEDGWRDKVAFPPVQVFEVDGELYVTDGFCRVVAAQNVGKSRIEAVIAKGTWKDALRAACGANSQHGLRRTVADKRKAANLAISEFPDESSRVLAEMVGVSHRYILNLRGQAATTDKLVSEVIGDAADDAVAVEPKAPKPIKRSAVEETLDVVSPPGWRCSDCHGTEQRLSDGGYVCRACFLPAGDVPVDAPLENVSAEPVVVETFPPVGDPIPEKMGKVHSDWGRFIRSTMDANCDHVISKEIESITNKLKGLK